MRARISKRNINFYLRQEYGIKSVDFLFEGNRNTKANKRILEKIVEEFTAYSFKDGKLATYNPYTGKYESLNITSLMHIHSEELLLKELSTLHKARMKMLQQSRKKIVQLSKKKDRNKDLEAKVDRRTEREKQLLQNTTKEQNQDLEH